MSESEKNIQDQPLTANDLAFERTVLAENRTLMAWIRTAVSLISFGFTLYKFFEEAVEKTVAHQKFFTPRRLGMTMIFLGLLSLVWALAEHKAIIRKLKRSYPDARQSNSAWLAMTILFLGLGMFFIAFFRQ